MPIHMLELGSTKLKLRITHQFLKTNIPLVLISFDTSFKCGSEIIILQNTIIMHVQHICSWQLFLLPLRMNGMQECNLITHFKNSITQNLITRVLKLLPAKCSIGARVFGFWSILPTLSLTLGDYYWKKSQTACRKTGKHLPGNKIWKQATVHQKTPGQ